MHRITQNGALNFKIAFVSLIFCQENVEIQDDYNMIKNLIEKHAYFSNQGYKKHRKIKQEKVQQE